MPDQKISQLTAANTLDATELVPVVQDGQTRQTTVDAIRTEGGDLVTETSLTVGDQASIGSDVQAGVVIPPQITLTDTAGTVQAQIRANTTNVGVGLNALDATTTGINNSAIGTNALTNLTTGSGNMAIGTAALTTATTGGNNVAVGVSALNNLTTGGSNVALGLTTLNNLTTGGSNAAIGLQTGYVSGNTPNAANALTTGAGNVFVGTQAGFNSATQRNFTTAVGYRAATDGNNAAALGSSTNAGAAGAVAIGCDSSGAGANTAVANEIKLGTTLHSVSIPGASASIGTNPALTGAVRLANNTSISHRNQANSADIATMNVAGDNNLYFSGGASFVSFGNQFRLTTGGAIQFGAAQDANLTRQAAGVISTGGVFRTGSGATGSRPSAVTAGAGGIWYDTTLVIPIFSDGAVWRDATGAAV